jgi:hypothetical protein
VPLTVSVKALAPATFVLGLRLLIVDTGVALIVKVAGEEVPPPVVLIVTLGVPGAAIIPAVIGALQPHGVIALYREKNAAIHARLEVALSDELGSRVVPELVEQLAVDAEKRAAGQT